MASFLTMQELNETNGFDTGSPSQKGRRSEEAAAQMPDEESSPMTPSLRLDTSKVPTVEGMEKQLAETNEELRFLQERCIQFEVSSRHWL